jgi:hypothetical protein
MQKPSIFKAYVHESPSFKRYARQNGKLTICEDFRYPFRFLEALKD